MIENIPTEHNAEDLNKILVQYTSLYQILSERTIDPRVRNMISLIKPLDEVTSIIRSCQTSSIPLFQTPSTSMASNRSRLPKTINSPSIKDDPENYLRFSPRKRLRTLSDQEKRLELLDFIKTKLDGPLYNKYMTSINRKDFRKTLEMIDDTMYQIKAISENPNLSFSMTQDQMRQYLLEPVKEAAANGNETAQEVMILAARSQYEMVARISPSNSSSSSITAVAATPSSQYINSSPSLHEETARVILTSSPTLSALAEESSPQIHSHIEALAAQSSPFIRIDSTAASPLPSPPLSIHKPSRAYKSQEGNLLSTDKNLIRKNTSGNSRNA